MTILKNRDKLYEHDGFYNYIIQSSSKSSSKRIKKDTYENNNIETIVKSIVNLWLNEKNIEEKLGHKSLPAYYKQIRSKR